MPVAEFAHVGRHGIMWHGRVIDDHPLPGDEEDLLAHHISRAIKRDEWYNPDELEVYMCMRTRVYYDTVWCFTECCTWCGNQWGVWG